VSTISPSPRLPPAAQTRARLRRLNKTDLRANRVLRTLALIAGAILVLIMAAAVWQILDGASMAFDKFGLGFITSNVWLPNLNKLGAVPFIYGTLVSSLVSLVFSTILGVSIGLFLALMAPRSVSAVIGPLVELLAAIPTVILGLIGIIVISPFAAHVLQPAFHAVLGFLPIFGPPQPSGDSIFTASLVLTIMIVPIISALTRDIFQTVPQDLQDGAEALGATRWEMIRGVILPTSVSGIIGACVLGFGRAIGEAIAVSQVIGDSTIIHTSVFLPGTTMAAAIADEFQSPQNSLTQSALIYLALILLVMSVIVNLISRSLVRRGTHS
jgi:phosphate transport system permease protein